MPRNTDAPYNYKVFDSSVYGIEPFAEVAPRIGECAADFEAKTLSGEVVKLSDFKGRRIVLETGSLTCPMFGGNIPDMNTLAERFANDDTVFLVLYTREAHPGGRQPAHEDFQEKIAAAEETSSLVSSKRLLLIDDVEGTIHRQWGEFPNSLWVIDRDGTVIYRSDWNKPDTLLKLLEAEDPHQLVPGLEEHVKPDMTKPVSVMRWLFTKAGWRSIWDVISQAHLMAGRHKEVDGFYEGVQFVEARHQRGGVCW